MVSPTPRGNEGWTGAGQLALLLSKITKFTRNLCFPSCIIILANSPHFSSSQPPYHPIFPKHFSMHICKICVFAKYTYFPPTAICNISLLSANQTLQEWIFWSLTSTSLTVTTPSPFPSPLNHVLLVPKQRDLIVLPIVPKYLWSSDIYGTLLWWW